ncbi:hypothetical protein Holit_03059 [Hollandina sp. SP2]
MEENKRLYPISKERLNRKGLPIIAGNYLWKGHLPKVSPYKAFCGILYVLEVYGYGHVIYDRFSWRDCSAIRREQG